MTKRSRTLRSTAARESVDSGVELEMVKKSRVKLDIVTEKADEEQTVTNSDTCPTTSRTVAEPRRKTKENKENIGIEQILDDSKQMDAEKECDKDDHRNTQQTSNVVSSPNNIVSTQVLYQCSLNGSYILHSFLLAVYFAADCWYV